MKGTPIKNSKLKVQAAFLGITLIAYAGIGCAAITSGKLVIYNGLANINDDGPGNTASPIKVVVEDVTGPCSTTVSVAYEGIVALNWSESFTHSTTKCNTPTKVTITPLKPTVSSVVHYDATANTTPPATATSIELAVPTTVKANEVLMITGNGTGDITDTPGADVWSSASAYTATVPAYSASNGALETTGILGVVNAFGLRAINFMQVKGVSFLDK